MGTRNQSKKENRKFDSKASFLAPPCAPGSTGGPPGCQSGSSKYAKLQVRAPKTAKTWLTNFRTVSNGQGPAAKGVAYRTKQMETKTIHEINTSICIMSKQFIPKECCNTFPGSTMAGTHAMTARGGQAMGTSLGILSGLVDVYFWNWGAAFQKTNESHEQPSPNTNEKQKRGQLWCKM